MQAKPQQPPSTEPNDRTIKRFEELLTELQMIFLEIFSNYARRDRET